MRLSPVMSVFSPFRVSFFMLFCQGCLSRIVLGNVNMNWKDSLVFISLQIFIFIFFVVAVQNIPMNSSHFSRSNRQLFPTDSALWHPPAVSSKPPKWRQPTTRFQPLRAKRRQVPQQHCLLRCCKGLRTGQRRSKLRWGGPWARTCTSKKQKHSEKRKAPTIDVHDLWLPHLFRVTQNIRTVSIYVMLLKQWSAHFSRST